MARLRAAINTTPILKERLFQAEFLASELLITLIYHKQLGEAWVAPAQKLAEALGAHLIGRAKKQRIVLKQAPPSTLGSITRGRRSIPRIRKIRLHNPMEV